MTEPSGGEVPSCEKCLGLASEAAAGFPDTRTGDNTSHTIVIEIVPVDNRQGDIDDTRLAVPDIRDIRLHLPEPSSIPRGQFRQQRAAHGLRTIVTEASVTSGVPSISAVMRARETLPASAKTGLEVASARQRPDVPTAQ